MEVIIDIQFCKNSDNKNIPKEVAIVSVNDEYTGHWIVLPPYSVKRLHLDARMQNNWLTQNHHGLTWFDGDVTHKSLQKNLNDIAKQVGKIYVRGRDKVDFLQTFLINEIINLEDDETCPSFENLTWRNYYCIKHALKFCYLSYSCALNNAYKLKVWLKHQRTVVTLSEHKENKIVAKEDEQYTDIEPSAKTSMFYNRGLC